MRVTPVFLCKMFPRAFWRILSNYCTRVSDAHRQSASFDKNQDEESNFRDQKQILKALGYVDMGQTQRLLKKGKLILHSNSICHTSPSSNMLKVVLYVEILALAKEISHRFERIWQSAL